MPTPPDSLADLRREIDAINLALRDLLQRRARLVESIARTKRARGLPIADPEREAAMLETLLDAPGAGFDRDTLAGLLRAVFAASRALAERTAAEPER
jgi:chorismate mutase